MRFRRVTIRSWWDPLRTSGTPVTHVGSMGAALCGHPQPAVVVSLELGEQPECLRCIRSLAALAHRSRRRPSPARGPEPPW